MNVTYRVFPLANFTKVPPFDSKKDLAETTEVFSFSCKFKKANSGEHLQSAS